MAKAVRKPRKTGKAATAASATTKRRSPKAAKPRAKSPAKRAAKSAPKSAAKTAPRKSAAKPAASAAAARGAKGYGLHDSVGYWVTRLSNVMQENLSERFKGHDVTAAQWTVLCSLYSGVADTPAGLADYIGIDRSAMTRLVDRLVDKKLVQRSRDESDRRSIKLTLTPEAKSMVPKLTKLDKETGKHFLKALTEQERNTFRDIVRKLLKAGGAEPGKLWS